MDCASRPFTDSTGSANAAGLVLCMFRSESLSIWSENALDVVDAALGAASAPRQMAPSGRTLGVRHP